jgi:hypothetical protein
VAHTSATRFLSTFAISLAVGFVWINSLKGAAADAAGYWIHDANCLNAIAHTANSHS